MERPEFKPFPSIARLHRDCCITEKIDGTNAVVTVDASATGGYCLQAWSASGNIFHYDSTTGGLAAGVC